MARKRIRKRTYTITVLYSPDDYEHPEGFDAYGYSLRSIDHEISDGPAIGKHVQIADDEVPDDQVVSELLDLNNDGEFFDLDEIDDEPIPVVPMPADELALERHLREMHGSLVYDREFWAEHDEQHAEYAAGRRDPNDLWTPHTHPQEDCWAP